jgi:shikimate 5-dehydrogenase
MFALKAKVLILNRTVANAKALADTYNFHWGALDEVGANFMKKYNYLIVQTTAVGAAPREQDDPFTLYDFTGREIVYDIINQSQKTAFLKRAEKAGCLTINGDELVTRQAMYQHQIFFN